MNISFLSGEWVSAWHHLKGKIASLAIRLWLENLKSRANWGTTKFKPIYGVYLEKQFAPRGKRGKESRRKRGKIPGLSIILISPRFKILGIKIGIRVEGIHFNRRRIIREFSSKRIILLQTDPHVLQYLDLTTQGTQHFTCKGVIWFRARNLDKFNAATGRIHVPNRGKAPENSLHKLYCQWARISVEDLQAATGKSEFNGIQDIVELIQAKYMGDQNSWDDV